MTEFTPHEDYEGPVLVALLSLGGRCESLTDWVEAVKHAMGSQLKPGDFDWLEGSGRPRWQEMARWWMAKPYRRDDLVRRVGRGKYELTEEGRKAAELAGAIQNSDM